MLKYSPSEGSSCIGIGPSGVIDRVDPAPLPAHSHHQHSNIACHSQVTCPDATDGVKIKKAVLNGEKHTNVQGSVPDVFEDFCLH